MTNPRPVTVGGLFFCEPGFLVARAVRSGGDVVVRVEAATVDAGPRVFLELEFVDVESIEEVVRASAGVTLLTASASGVRAPLQYCPPDIVFADDPVSPGSLAPFHGRADLFLSFSCRPKRRCKTLAEPARAGTQLCLLHRKKLSNPPAPGTPGPALGLPVPHPPRQPRPPSTSPSGPPLGRPGMA